MKKNVIDFSRFLENKVNESNEFDEILEKMVRSKTPTMTPFSESFIATKTYIKNGVPVTEQIPIEEFFKECRRKRTKIEILSGWIRKQWALLFYKHEFQESDFHIETIGPFQPSSIKVCTKCKKIDVWKLEQRPRKENFGCIR